MTMTRRFACFVALPAVIGATLGLAGTANAAAVAPQSNIVAVPQTTAQPAMTAMPGNWWHQHHPSLLDPTTAANFTLPGA